ncbi:MAG: hypothetical protein H7338_02565 [Candidatus Sericytochromatia bacterium]|nr:hypothetical protein [Candidatus Sericytochromatia bacterium]
MTVMTLQSGARQAIETWIGIIDGDMVRATQKAPRPTFIGTGRRTRASAGRRGGFLDLPDASLIVSDRIDDSPGVIVASSGRLPVAGRQPPAGGNADHQMPDPEFSLAHRMFTAISRVIAAQNEGCDGVFNRMT